MTVRAERGRNGATGSPRVPAVRKPAEPRASALAPSLQLEPDMVVATLPRERHGSTLDLIERRLRDVLFNRDLVTFAPVHAIALATSKRLRAALTLTCARAVELPERVALEIAVVVELVHTFSLVHDDIEDGAESRRGHPAVHVVDGVPVAINAGDALHALAWSRVLALDAPPRRTLDVARMFGATLDRMVAGQARDLVWTRDRPELSFDDYLEMVRGKTGALLGFAAAAPAELLGHDTAGRLYAFGEELGVALQLLDDVAGVRGDAQRLGKPIANGFGAAPALLAAEGHDGVERAIELAHRHVDIACEELEATGLPGTLEIRMFAETMLARLLDHATEPPL